VAAHKLLEGGGVAVLRGGDERFVLQRSPLAESTPQRSRWFPTASSANATSLAGPSVIRLFDRHS
jgi:hypothetical protein